MLTADQIDQYRRDGFTMASDIFQSAEIDRLEAAFDGILERRLRNHADLDATWSGDWKEKSPDNVILLTHDVQAYSAEWTKVLTHDRFTAALAQCLGSDNVQLHHTKLFCKPPEHGSGFPMHQDAPYFPHEKGTMMAAVIHLSDATEEMGCFRVYPSTHKDSQLLPTVPGRSHYIDPEKYPIEGGTPLPARRGDVLFFHYRLIHGSGPNSSPMTRKTVLIQVRDADDRPLEERHLSMGQGTMLRGVNPLSHGESAAPGTLDGKRASAGKNP